MGMNQAYLLSYRHAVFTILQISSSTVGNLPNGTQWRTARGRKKLIYPLKIVLLTLKLPSIFTFYDGRKRPSARGWGIYSASTGTIKSIPAATETWQRTPSLEVGSEENRQISLRRVTAPKPFILQRSSNGQKVAPMSWQQNGEDRSRLSHSEIFFSNFLAKSVRRKKTVRKILKVPALFYL